MPEPPETLSPAAQARAAGVQARASSTAATQAALPAAGEQVEDARQAVTTPVEERAARAQGALVEALGQQPEPSPEIEALCQRIRDVIRRKRPPDEDSLVEARPDEMAREAGSDVGQGVQGEVNNVQGSYQGIQQEPAPAPAEPREELPPPPEAAAAPPIHAAQAAPDPVPAENTSLDADVAANRQRMDEAGMSSEPAQLVQTGPVAEARRAQGELEQVAAEDPALVQARQATAINAARGDMAQLQEAALEALQSSRSRTTTGARAQQDRMVGSEEQMRSQASARAQTLFDDAQRRVEGLLQPLSDTAMRRWDTGIERLSNDFKTNLRKVQKFIDERHSGVLGTLVSGADYLFGLPRWVTEEYDKAEQAFGDGACELARDISREVNGVIATCEAIIEQARADIAQVFSQLPASLQEWAATEQNRLGQSLDGLRDNARKQRDQFNQQLVQRASQAVQEVRQEIHGLRQKARGLVGRIADAVNAFLQDPAKFIIEGLLSLLGIPPAAFWAVVARIRQVISDIADDPLGFAGKLLSAVGDGFQLFFDNVGSHLLRGLVEWLFAGLAGVGVQIPRDLSLKSIITFFLQLMGISWDRIRRILVRRIGERNVGLIEKAWTIISTLIEQGPAGIFELIKDKLNPQQILDQVLTAARDALIEMVITRVTARILLLFNPVGAIVQALEAIYRVLKWLFQNAARIFSLVETVVNGIADILRGNTAGMAKAVEQALARLITPVIAFLADYLGLGGLPERIKGVIEKMQGWVEGILDSVIGWLVTQGQRLLSAVGLGGRQEPAAQGAGEVPSEVGTTVRFGAAGESHRLWIETRSGSLAVMVASRETPVQDKVLEWEQKLAAEPNLLIQRRRGGQTDDTKRKEAQRLVGVAKDKLGLTQKEATEAKKEIQEATQQHTATETAQANQANQEAENAEQTLAQVLTELFKLFGERNPFSHPVYALIGTQVAERKQNARDVAKVPEPQDYEFRWTSANSIYIQRKSGKAEEAPAVHIDERGFLREGLGSNAQDLSWLATEEVKKLVAEAASKATNKGELKWVAVFATTGASLLTREEGKRVPLTLEKIWAATPSARATAETLARNAIILTLAGGGTPTRAMRTEATQLATTLLDRVATLELHFITPTIIPRDLPGSDLVKVNGNASRSAALYESISRESEHRLLNLGTDATAHEIQIHHVVPLYLGGTHQDINLVSALGDAKVAEGAADTAHKLLHDLIDMTTVAFYLEKSDKEFTSTLKFTELARTIPADLMKILIGTLYDNGHVDYVQKPIKPPSANPSSESGG